MDNICRQFAIVHINAENLFGITDFPQCGPVGAFGQRSLPFLIWEQSKTLVPKLSPFGKGSKHLSGGFPRLGMIQNSRAEAFPVWEGFKTLVRKISPLLKRIFQYVPTLFIQYDNLQSLFWHGL